MNSTTMAPGGQGANKVNNVNDANDANDASVAAGDALSRRIRHLLAWQFGVDVETIEMETALVDQLYSDSLDLMEMTHILNREFDIDIEPEQLVDMHTVGGVERVVAAKLRAIDGVETH